LNILPSYTEYFSLTTATLGLNTAALNIGGALSGFFGGYIIDRWGRKAGIYVGCALTFIAIILQTAAQNTGMFVVARILIGLGVGIENTAISVFLGELVPYNYRDYLMGAFNDCWYIGK
jgi:MFS family permease